MKAAYRSLLSIVFFGAAAIKPASAAAEPLRPPDKLPFKTWGEVKEGTGAEHEGRVLDLYGEQGAAWKIDDTGFDFMPFIGMQYKHSDETSQSWNNYWKPIVGFKIKHDFTMPGDKKDWLDGTLGVQFDVNMKHFTSGNPEDNPSEELEVKLFYYMGGDWLKK